MFWRTLAIWLWRGVRWLWWGTLKYSVRAVTWFPVTVACWVYRESADANCPIWVDEWLPYIGRESWAEAKQMAMEHTDESDEATLLRAIKGE